MKIENKSDIVGIEHCYLCGNMILGLTRYYKDNKPVCNGCLNDILEKLHQEIKIEK